MNDNYEAMSEPTLIKNWDELAKVAPSETHYLEITPKDCNGWILVKNPKSDKFSDWKQYLSTDTFYGLNREYSTKLLQDCGFNVIIENWDKSE